MEATAKALLIDTDALASAQPAGALVAGQGKARDCPWRGVPARCAIVRQDHA
jgi:hypothetical protein